MKQILVALLVVFISLTSFAQKVNWMTWDEAFAANQQEQKMIFVDTYTNWCGWCKTMDRNTFANPTIAAYMNEHFYSVKFNAETRDTIIFNNQAFVNPNPKGKRSAHQFAVALLDGKMSYPSYAIIGQYFENGKLVVSGYQAPKDFEKLIRYLNEGLPAGLSQQDYLAEFTSILPKEENAAN